MGKYKNLGKMILEKLFCFCFHVFKSAHLSTNIVRIFLSKNKLSAVCYSETLSIYSTIFNK